MILEDIEQLSGVASRPEPQNLPSTIKTSEKEQTTERKN